MSPSQVEAFSIPMTQEVSAPKGSAPDKSCKHFDFDIVQKSWSEKVAMGQKITKVEFCCNIKQNSPKLEIKDNRRTCTLCHKKKFGLKLFRIDKYNLKYEFLVYFVPPQFRLAEKIEFICYSCDKSLLTHKTHPMWLCNKTNV